MQEFFLRSATKEGHFHSFLKMLRDVVFYHKNVFF